MFEAVEGVKVWLLWSCVWCVSGNISFYHRMCLVVSSSILKGVTHSTPLTPFFAPKPIAPYSHITMALQKYILAYMPPCICVYVGSVSSLCGSAAPVAATSISNVFSRGSPYEMSIVLLIPVRAWRILQPLPDKMYNCSYSFFCITFLSSPCAGR